MQHTDKTSRWVQLLGRWSSKEIGSERLDKHGKFQDPAIFTSSPSRQPICRGEERVHNIRDTMRLQHNDDDKGYNR